MSLLFAWYGLGFVDFDVILLFGLLRSVGFIACLLWFMRVVLGSGPVHLLSASAAEIGFDLESHALAWIRPGLSLIGDLAGPIQHFQSCYS